MTKHETSLKKLTESLLEKLDIKAKVAIEKDEQESWHVKIETEDSGLLIGYHGETLNSLQLMLNLMFAKAIGSFERVIVHVGDYREKRREYLEDLAQRKAELVEQTGQEEVLPPMSSFERRLIHVALAENKNVTTESIGEDSDRRLVIKPKK